MPENGANPSTSAPESEGGPTGAGQASIEAIERRLRADGIPFARATVVRREPPVSATVGDRALITADGAIHGWIGGTACAQTVVREEATASIDAGEPRLVGIAPDPEAIERPGLAAFPMTCHSEGTLEVFIEPVIGRPTLVLVGDSPVVAALARMARELPVEVLVVDPDETTASPESVTHQTDLEPTSIAEAAGPEPIVVVASMGRFDARGVAAGVVAEAPYIGLIASRDRAEQVIERAASLLDVEPTAVAESVTNPAGVDVGAESPPEIAVSVLAEVVDVMGSVSSAIDEPVVDTASEQTSISTGATSGGAETANEPQPGPEPQPEPDDNPLIDPVCGMAVSPAEAAATVQHEGTEYVFCCPGCADRFRNDPSKYLTESEAD